MLWLAMRLLFGLAGAGAMIEMLLNDGGTSLRLDSKTRK